MPPPPAQAFRVSLQFAAGQLHFSFSSAGGGMRLSVPMCLCANVPMCQLGTPWMYFSLPQYISKFPFPPFSPGRNAPQARPATLSSKMHETRHLIAAPNKYLRTNRPVAPYQVLHSFDDFQAVSAAPGFLMCACAVFNCVLSLWSCFNRTFPYLCRTALNLCRIKAKIGHSCVPCQSLTFPHLVLAFHIVLLSYSAGKLSGFYQLLIRCAGRVLAWIQNCSTNSSHCASHGHDLSCSFESHLLATLFSFFFYWMRLGPKIQRLHHLSCERSFAKLVSSSNMICPILEFVFFP